MSQETNQKNVPRNIFDPEDLKAVWKIFSKNFWLFILIPGLFAFVSYFYTHKLTRVFGSRTQILLKSNEIYDYQNPLNKGLGYYGIYGDISNQIRVIQSYDLIKKTLSKLNYKISYYIIGRIKTTELYKNMPYTIEINLLNSALEEVPINFKIIDIKNYAVSFNVNGNEIKKILPFNKEIIDENFVINVKKTNTLNAESVKYLVNNDYSFVVHSMGFLVNKYLSSLTVENIEYTTILDIGVRDEIAFRGKQFLDTLARVYADYSLETEYSINDKTVEYIDKQLKDVTQIMDSIETELEMYRSGKGVIDIPKESEAFFNEMLRYDGQKRDLMMKKKAIEYLEQYLYDEKSDLLPPAFYILENDYYLKTAVAKIQELETHLSESEFSTTPNHVSTIRDKK